MFDSEDPTDDELARLIARAFSGADPADAQTLLATGRLHRYGDGELLCREGDPADTFFFITRGAVALTQHLGTGITRTVAVRERGEFFGEMGLLEGKPRSATATALGGATVLEVTEAAFQAMLVDRPRLALAIVRGLVANVRSADRAALVELQTSNLALKAALDSLQAAQAGLLQKERLEHELTIAGAVQRSLLPAPFESLGSFTFAGRNLPARHVGGDLYDVIRLSADRVALLLADVSDKGVQAALFMAVTRTLFLAHARTSPGPAAVVTRVHQGLREIAPESDMFVTAFYGELDLTDGSLRYVRAGHDEPLLFTVDGGVSRLSGRGRFLGALDGLDIEERLVHLPVGSALVIYSDGVTDAVEPGGQPYPAGAFRAAVARRLAEPAARIAESLVDDVIGYGQGAALTDDLTVLVAKRGA